MKVYSRPRESEILNCILEGLNKLPEGSFDRVNNLPAWNQKTNSYNRPSRYAPKGMSDIIGCYKGHYVAIEVKIPVEYNWVQQFYKRVKHQIDSYQPQTDKEIHALHQIKYIRNKISRGGIGFFAYSLENVLEQLKKVQ